MPKKKRTRPKIWQNPKNWNFGEVIRGTTIKIAPAIIAIARISFDQYFLRNSICFSPFTEHNGLCSARVA